MKDDGEIKRKSNKIDKISRMWIGKSKGRRKNGTEYTKKMGFWCLNHGSITIASEKASNSIHYSSNMWRYWQLC